MLNNEVLDELEIDQIVPFKEHMFKTMDDDKMMELVDSIKDHGVIEPAVVFINEDGNYEMIAGHRRKRACELAGLPGMDKPYEKVKELMRGHEISKDDVERFIDQQAFDEATAARLKALAPATYTGVASKLVDFDR